MKVLVVGSGGREHALCWAISKSPLCDKIYCLPGNAGISSYAECVNIKVNDIEGIISFAEKESIDFAVIGPEEPLVLGISDELKKKNIKTFGPSASAAKLEGSKAFMKDIVYRNNIPTASYGCFSDIDKAKQYIHKHGAPIVVKTSGLAAGKGVFICNSVNEAINAVDKIMDEKIFGLSGREIIIEEFLEGEEVSFFALVNGKKILPLASAQDHKAVGDGDTGPNTGGMGAYSPAPIMNSSLEKKIIDEIILPTTNALIDQDSPYQGVLFAGLMITKEGPKLLEYNIRFGDPECQVLMRRLKSDLLSALIATCDNQLDNITLKWCEEKAIVVIMASDGYPGDYKKGSIIENTFIAEKKDEIEIFHSGTLFKNDDLIASGGRVLGVTAIGKTVTEAHKNVYEAINLIKWPEGFYRKDIGWRAIKLEK